jgi:hypothetical protein
MSHKYIGIREVETIQDALVYTEKHFGKKEAKYLLNLWERCEKDTDDGYVGSFELDSIKPEFYEFIGAIAINMWINIEAGHVYFGLYDQEWVGRVSV